jgi:hypothetical protein
MTVATFHEKEDAEKLAEMLRKGGFLAEVQDERKLQKYWLRSRAYAGVHLRVSESCFVEAQDYLNSNPSAEPLLQHAIRCPSCDSSRIQYPAMTRKNILPTLVAQLFFLVGIMNRECYCRACHYTWRPARESSAGDYFGP